MVIYVYPSPNLLIAFPSFSFALPFFGRHLAHLHLRRSGRGRKRKMGGKSNQRRNLLNLGVYRYDWFGDLRMDLSLILIHLGRGLLGRYISYQRLLNDIE